MWNWTRTQGGPYYVEVGKNVKVDYMSRENVTVIGYTGNQNVTSVNGTNVTVANQTYTTT